MELSHESLWDKSRLLMDRALEARDGRRQDDFYLWVALVLEMLGKSHLARLHPALVADARHTDTMLAICAGTPCEEHRTIGAKEVFARCQRTAKGFDANTAHFCARLAEDRNAHLHSGALPFANPRDDVWESKCWSVIDVLIEAQGRRLEDFVGAEEAQAARRIIKDTARVREEVVRRRLASHLETFKKLDRGERSAREAAAKLYELSVDQDGDSTRIAHACPACGCPGALDGEEFDAERTDASDPTEPWWRWFVCFYATESFRCISCALRLEGADEIAAAGLPDTYEKLVLREVELDDEPYGDE